MPHETYKFDPQFGTWERKRAEAEPFPYNDGDEPEQYVWRSIQGAADIRSGSTELAQSIRDWPSLYHLSPLRANLLRPVASLLRGSVLEVGSGCGALTRYVGETASTVVAVEGSRRRAAITASRCRDLDNVSVVCDDFNVFEDDRQFDCVLLIGVLEYSRTVGTEPAADAAMLSRCRQFLNPHGCLIVGIENQLGLKYLSGAPEDHLGIPYLGVEGLYTTRSPVTWGRRELTDKLERAGFDDLGFLYPFPDYKLPRVVLSHGFLDLRNEALISDLLSQFGGATHDALPYLRQFSEAAAWPAIVRNGFVADLANSFLIVASSRPQPHPAEAFVYSTNRLRPFQCETVFRPENGAIRMSKRRLHEEALLPHDGRFSWRLPDKGFIEGKSLATAVESVMNRSHWTVPDVSAAMQQYADFLRAAALADEGHQTSPAISGEYLDCTPGNVIVAANGALEPFDLEWTTTEPLPAGYVYFRGILSVLAHVAAAAPTHHIGDFSFVALARALMESAGFSFSDDEIAAYSEREAEFQRFALGRTADDHRSWTRARLKVRAQVGFGESEALRAELSRLNGQHQELMSALRELHAAEMKRLRGAARDVALTLISALSE